MLLHHRWISFSWKAVSHASCSASSSSCCLFYAVHVSWHGMSSSLSCRKTCESNNNFQILCTTRNITCFLVLLVDTIVQVCSTFTNLQIKAKTRTNILTLRSLTSRSLETSLLSHKSLSMFFSWIHGACSVLQYLVVSCLKCKEVY